MGAPSPRWASIPGMHWNSGISGLTYSGAELRLQGSLGCSCKSSQSARSFQEFPKCSTRARPGPRASGSHPSVVAVVIPAQPQVLPRRPGTAVGTDPRGQPPQQPQLPCPHEMVFIKKVPRRNKYDFNTPQLSPGLPKKLKTRSTVSVNQFPVVSPALKSLESKPCPLGSNSGMIPSLKKRPDTETQRGTATHLRSLSWAQRWAELCHAGHPEDMTGKHSAKLAPFLAHLSLSHT